MSIEYFCHPSPPLNDVSLELFVNSIQVIPDIHVVRRAQDEIGLGLISGSTQEDVTIIVKPDEVYVGFHSATRNQRNCLLQRLQQLIENMGSQATFNED